MGAKYKIVVKDQQGTKTAYSLRDRSIVGRRAPADIVLGGKVVSSQHAKFEVLGDRVMVEDLGSANGVYVNGEKIDRPVFLTKTDVVQIGEYQCKVKRSDGAAEEGAPAAAPASTRKAPASLDMPLVPNFSGGAAPAASRRAPPDDAPPIKFAAAAHASAAHAPAAPDDGIEEIEDDFPPPVAIASKRPESMIDHDDSSSGSHMAVEAVPPPEPKPAAEAKPEVRTDDDYLMVFLQPIRKFLEDPTLSEIMVNRFDEIWIERKGKIIRTDARFGSDMALRAAIENVANAVGRRIDEMSPQLDARLPDGSRVHAVLPPCARKGCCLDIRKFSREKLTIDKLIEFGSMTPDMAKFLDGTVKIAKNLMVSGGTGSGKTSLLNVVSSLIPEHDRILVIEDAAELQLQQEHILPFETRTADKKGKGLVSIRHLIHSALRLRPDRIVIGEIRGGEALDLLQAMNTGHGGSMSTIHANSPADTLSRLETCCLMAGVDLPHRAIRDQIASAIEVVVYTARLNDGSRKTMSIAEIAGQHEDGKYKVNEIFKFEREGISKEGKVIGRHRATGNLPTYYEQFQHAGIDMPRSMFERGK